MSCKMTIVTDIPPNTFSILWATTFIQHMTQMKWLATTIIQHTSSNWNTRVIEYLPYRLKEFQMLILKRDGIVAAYLTYFQCQS